jgi:hypothetical protein
MLYTLLIPALLSSAPLVRGQGTPSLMAPSAYTVQPGTVPIGVVTGEFSSSGYLDFAVLEQNPNTGLDQVEIFHGNPNGSFCTNCGGGSPDPDLIPLAVPSSTVSGHAIATGQFRSSTGVLDIAVATSAGIVFLQNSGTGTFTRNDALTLSAGNNFTSLVVGMFKGDGNYDLAAVSAAVSGSVPLTIFVGDGSGNFSASAPYSVSNTYSKCSAMLQGNFQSQTAQSDLALLCNNPSEASVLVYLNNLDGSGNFSPGQVPYTGSAFFGELPGIAVGTLNSQATIFVAPLAYSFESFQSNGLTGTSNGFTSVFMIPVGLAPRGILAVLYDPPTGTVDFADFNTGVSLSTFTSYTQSGTSINGTWNSTAGLGPGAVLATGFSPNLTASPYVVIGAGVHEGTYPNFEPYVDERSISVFLASLNPNGTVASTNAAPIYSGTGGSGYSFPPTFATGDFNNDGVLDLAVAGADGATGDATLTIYLANADGSIPTTTSVPVITVSNTDYSGADAVVAGKFRPTQTGQTSPYYDLAIFSQGQVFVIPSTGNGNFGTPTTIPISTDPNYPGFEYNPSAGHSFAPGLTAADINGDGLDDLVLTLPEDNCNGNAQGAVYVLISNGDGTFQTPVFVAPPVVNPVSVAAAKFYGTSVPDLVFADGGEFCNGNSAANPLSAVGILQNNVPPGSSSVTASEFTSASVLPQTSDLPVPNATAVASADFNGDGQPDLVVSNTNGLQVLLNQGGGKFLSTTQGIVPLYSGDVVPGPLCNSPDGYVNCVTYDSQVTTGSFFALGEYDVAASVAGVAYVFQNQGTGILSAPTQGFVAGPNSTMVSGALSNSNGLNGLLVATSQGTTYLVNGSAQPSPSYANYSNIGPINFGSVQVDSIATQTLTVTNTGGLPFTVTGFSVSGAGYSLASSVCNGVPFVSSAALNSGASCSLTLQFAPTTAGQPAGQITITDTASGSNVAGSGSQSIYLTGTAAAIPTTTTLSLSPSTVTVGATVRLGASVTTSSGNVGSVGTVTFYNGTAALGSSPVSGGIGSISLSNLAAGSYPVSAVYQDSSNTYAGSTSLSTRNLLVIPVQLDPPQIAQAFGVPSIPLNGVTSLTISISNPNSSSALSGVAFTDSFPSGLAVALPNNLTSSCGGTVAANGGGASLSLSGASLPAAGSCTISLNVSGTIAETITNSVTVTSAQTSAGNTSIASLSVQTGLISPASGTQGETFNMAIKGSGFVNGAPKVTFSTQLIKVNSVTVIDPGDAIANVTISPSALVESGKVGVYVWAPVRTLFGTFAVQPAALTVSPSTGAAGETMDVTLTGWTFSSGTTVLFGTGIAVNSLTLAPDGSQAVANITIASNATETGHTVSVTNAQGTQNFVNAFGVSSQSLTVSPSSGTAGENMDVTLTGWSFTSGTTVQFGGSSSGITLNSLTLSPDATQAIANITIASNAPAGAEGITIRNGQSTFNFAKAFGVGSAALTVSPNTGTSGETLDVTLIGWTFSNGTTIGFGGGTSGIKVNSVTVVSASEAIVNITIAKNAPQKAQFVSVNNGQTDFSFGNAFTVSPAALTVGPSGGTAGETLNVTLTGWTFPAGTTVAFGNAASGITVNSLMLSPDGTQAVANITIATNAPQKSQFVTIKSGQGMLSFANAFKVGSAAVIASPNLGTVGETMDVTLTGWTFLSGTTVTFGNSTSGITVNSVTVSPDATQAVVNITIATDAPKKTQYVTVNNGQGPFSFLKVFTVAAP